MLERVITNYKVFKYFPLFLAYVCKFLFFKKIFLSVLKA